MDGLHLHIMRSFCAIRTKGANERLLLMCSTVLALSN
jgi:hypothetical protein